MQIGVEMAKAIESKRVFIVDHDDIFRAAIQFMLHDEYEAHEVADLSSALEKSQTSPPDLIVLAENVVETHGVEVFQRLKDVAPQAKIMTIVEDLSNGLGKKYVDAGANGFLSKPLKIELVRDKVDALLRGRRSVMIPLTVLTVN